MRTVLPFNDWNYKDTWTTEDALEEGLEGFIPVTVPHTNREIPFNYFDERLTMFVSCYRKIFRTGPEWEGKRVFIRFGAVSSVAEVYLNGRLLGEHKGGYTAFEFELTEGLRREGENVITVKVDSTERSDVPPFGHLLDYLCYGGIYREVELIVSDDPVIRTMHLTPKEIFAEKKALEVCLYTDAGAPAEIPLTVQILRGGEVLREQTEQVNVPQGKGTVGLTVEGLEGIRLWQPEEPVLYTVRAALGDSVTEDRTGFREVRFEPDGFFLNGEKIKLCGLNRHQSFPYVGYAMPKRAQERDAEILKQEIGVNIVRTSHYPQSRHFLNRCDELGLLVFEEIPGWQYIGDEAWKDLAVRNVEDMIMEGYNHPSIILWGVRINESGNDFEFYERTNAMAHGMDPTRPTGGVKYIEEADFQEDVYVMNEFELGKSDRRHIDQNMATGLDHDVPFLISEYAGAWHPTKRWDDSKRREDQALRHAWGIDETALDDRLCGSLAWCAFDYNTHYQFGPGDRVCYHGVSDMFRIPKKMCTAVYESQLDPHVHPVLEPSIVWSNGDIDQCGFLPMYVFSNCDYVEFYFGGDLARRLFPYRQQFGGLKHAPMYLDRVYGSIWNRWDWLDATFIGYVDGKPVITRKFAKDPVPTELRVTPDDAVLTAQGPEEPWDATRVVFEAVDQCGNTLDYLMDSISFEVDGPAELIGPAQTTMQGGCIAAWIRTTGEKGTVQISAKTSRLASETVTVTVE